MPPFDRFTRAMVAQHATTHGVTIVPTAYVGPVTGGGSLNAEQRAAVRSRFILGGQDFRRGKKRHNPVRQIELDAMAAMRAAAARIFGCDVDAMLSERPNAQASQAIAACYIAAYRALGISANALGSLMGGKTGAGPQGVLKTAAARLGDEAFAKAVDEIAAIGAVE